MWDLFENFVKYKMDNHRSRGNFVRNGEGSSSVRLRRRKDVTNAANATNQQQQQQQRLFWIIISYQEEIWKQWENKSYLKKDF